MRQTQLEWLPARPVYTVSGLNARIAALLSGEFSDVLVSGEISGVKESTQGHLYFTLKDRVAQIRCVCFRNAARVLRTRPRDGLEVVARGKVDVYEPRGEYQLIIESLEPQGAGRLQLAFEQLKERLKAEGLFEAARKRPLPALPRRIGIVTSPSGAVIQDMIRILSRRFPGLQIILFPAQVQGPGAADQICAGLRYFSQSGCADVVIVARGGGSLEDLWTFNEETVARAIAGCAVPVVSAIGHESDFTIADFVADLRAPTPSAAAEMVTPLRLHVEQRIAALTAKLTQAMRYRLANLFRQWRERGIDRPLALLTRRLRWAQQRLDDAHGRLHAAWQRSQAGRWNRWREQDARLRRLDLRLRLADAHRRLDRAETAMRQSIARALPQARQRLERLESAASRAMTGRLADARMHLEPLAARLDQLSPLAVLERGYAIVEGPGGTILKDAGHAAAGDTVRIRLARGALAARVTSVLKHT